MQDQIHPFSRSAVSVAELCQGSWRTTLDHYGFGVAGGQPPQPSNARFLSSSRASAPAQMAEMELEGRSVAKLIQDFGTPLVVVSERCARDIVKRFRLITDVLDKSLLPQLHIGPCAAGRAGISGASALPAGAGGAGRGNAAALWRDDATKIFVTLSTSPRQALLSRMASWRLGFLVQNLGEIRRALSCRVDPRSLVFSSPFKSFDDIMFAHRIGALAVEIESLEEYLEIEARQSEFPSTLRLSLRLNPRPGSQIRGLDFDEFRYVSERLRQGTNLSVVGISVSWDNYSLIDFQNYKAVISKVRTLASELVAARMPLEFVMVGVRASLSSDDWMSSSFQDDFAKATQEVFHGAFFRVYFTPGDCLFKPASHVLARVVRRQQEKDGSVSCFLDTTLPRTPLTPGLLLPVTWPTSPVHQMPSSSIHRHVFLSRRDIEQGPQVEGSLGLPFRLTEGSAVALPTGGLARIVQLSVCSSLPRPTEILLTEDDEILVLRVRDNFETVLAGE